MSFEPCTTHKLSLNFSELKALVFLQTTLLFNKCVIDFKNLKLYKFLERQRRRIPFKSFVKPILETESAYIIFIHEETRFNRSLIPFISIC